MYIWEVLGIEPTADIVAIKRAFAQKAKLYHPEEHPEEYKNLRNAYKRATEYARQKNKEAALREKENESQGNSEGSTEEKGFSGEQNTRFGGFFREEEIEVPSVNSHKQAPHIETTPPKIEEPIFDRNTLQAPKIEEPILERPKIRSEYQEKVRLEIPHVEEPVLKNKQPKKPKIEGTNVEMPRIKELIQETSVLQTPMVADDVLWQISKEKLLEEPKTPVSKESDFSFDEVETAYSPEDIDEFFYYFQSVLSNPVLRDNVECWILFLERDELEDLYKREDVCDRMVEALAKCSWCSEAMLQYFEFFLSIKTNKKYPEFQSWRFKMKPKLWAIHKNKDMKLLSEEEVALHERILANLRRQNLSYDLVHFEAARIAYMEIYLDSLNADRVLWISRWKYAEEKRRDIASFRLYSVIIPLAVVIIGFLILILMIRGCSKEDHATTRPYGPGIETNTLNRDLNMY